MEHCVWWRTEVRRKEVEKKGEERESVLDEWKTKRVIENGR